ncbi:MAG: hypothetical protein JXM79_21105 [Sedimentisphaerales bacterium]|nr:hypothetical protein [Sedimentisphaerales bacterium]
MMGTPTGMVFAIFIHESVRYRAEQIRKDNLREPERRQPWKAKRIDLEKNGKQRLRGKPSLDKRHKMLHPSRINLLRLMIGPATNWIIGGTQGVGDPEDQIAY